jgi:murein DD-endopeptidase MepM/ murein hydrolase activator NlpD
MADAEARIAPIINEIFYVTAEFGQYPSGGVHNGVDISTGKNSNLYSIVNGIITNKGYNAGGWGYYICMKDLTTNQGFLYGHMKEASPLNVGDTVQYGTFVGIEGTTGNSTGIHLHISSQDMTNKDRWTFGLPISQLLDPTQYMGFPNTYGITVIYNGTPMPPTPPTPIFRKNNKFKWILYAKKLRSKNLFIN